MTKAAQRIEKFPVGGLSEYAEWELHFDEAVSIEFTHPSKPCHHCHSLRKDENGYWVVTCPRAVVSYTQCGHDFTCVCLDCILEADRVNKK